MTAFTKLTTTPLLFLSLVSSSESFTSHVGRTFAPLKSAVAEEITIDTSEEYERQSVRAPLKFNGPYPCLGLTFPNLATQAQIARNVSGVSLDFVLDTAANTNTINGQVAQALELDIVGQALPGTGAAGAIAGGATYLVGDCELEGLPKEEQFTFLQGLTASALPVASPAAAGLLSMPFFHCFEGGVEFQWGIPTTTDLVPPPPPSITFYGPGESDAVLEQMTKVPVKELDITRLPTVQLTVNGVTIPALLDTGSPITVINGPAAKQMKITASIDISATTSLPQNNAAKNPLTKLANRFQQAQAMAQSAARGDVLTIAAGASGERVDLFKSKDQVQVQLVAAAEGDLVDFGTSHIYIGNLPGLAALDALGDNSPPAAVLGMDVLRLRPKMLFKARDQEVYF